MFWGIDIKSGQVAYDDISFLSDNDNPLSQIDYLKEDMLQIKYDENYILDVGWRPSFDENGEFFIYLISNHDWSNPLVEKRTTNVKDLKKHIESIVDNYFSA